MIKINANTKPVLGMLGKFTQQMPFAISKGVNDRADSIKNHIVGQMPNYIDNPTRYTLNALQVTKGKKQAPTASVWFKKPDKPARTIHYLEPIVEGGPRRHKGTEVVFGKRWFAPGKAAKELGYIDQYGNFKASVLQQIRSYFGKAEQSAGFTANSKQANKDKLANMQRTLNGKKLSKKQLQSDPKRGYMTISGKRYFMSMGKGSGVSGKQHLSAGIWQKSGVDGVKVQPVFMEIKQPQYRKQFDFFGLAQRHDAKVGASIMQAAVDYAIKTAK